MAMQEDINKKGVPVTATMANDNVFTKKATVITGTPRANADSQRLVVTPAETTAKIQKILDILCNEFQNSANRVDSFFTKLPKALSLKSNKENSSFYRTFVLPNNKQITVRISNHNANVTRFENKDELESLSIVVSHFHCKVLKDSDKVHLVEYFYRKKDIEKSKSHPLAKIIQSLKEALQTGEYIDTTDVIHVRQETYRETVNIQNEIKQPEVIKKSSGLKF